MTVIQFTHVNLSKDVNVHFLFLLQAQCPLNMTPSTVGSHVARQFKDNRGNTSDYLDGNHWGWGTNAQWNVGLKPNNNLKQTFHGRNEQYRCIFNLLKYHKTRSGHSRECITDAYHSIVFIACTIMSSRDDITSTRRRCTTVSSRRYALCDTVTLTFDILTCYSLVSEVSWWTIPVPSSAILVSTVSVLSCGQTHRQTDRITDADDRCTRATTVDVSNLTEEIHPWDAPYITRPCTSPPHLVLGVRPPAPCLLVWCYMQQYWLAWQSKWEQTRWGSGQRRRWHVVQPTLDSVGLNTDPWTSSTSHIGLFSLQVHDTSLRIASSSVCQSYKWRCQRLVVGLSRERSFYVVTERRTHGARPSYSN